MVNFLHEHIFHTRLQTMYNVTVTYLCNRKCSITWAGPGFLGRGSYVKKGVGVRFANLISVLLNIS